jgi:NADH:ubiquinone oxidoreductase subunit 5 (subunit L)/multisubunit Na+/H+ antiporter MnhA subunit
VIFLIAAVFGSALTLASFVKVLHSVFLGRRPVRLDGVKEVGFTMQLPMILLAILCVLFGIFARYPLETYIIPVVGAGALSVDAQQIITPEGMWSPGAATIMIVIGVIVGMIIYVFGKIRKIRVVEDVWTGGNIMDNEEMRIPGTHFYKTVTNEINPVFTAAFRDGEQGALDIYNVWGKLGNSLVQVLRGLHNGILSTYLSWAIIGLGVLAFILMFH